MAVETTTFIPSLYKCFWLSYVPDILNPNIREGRMWTDVKPSSPHASDIFPWLQHGSTFPIHKIIITILKMYKCIYTYFINLGVIKIVYRLTVHSEDCCRPAMCCTNKNYFFRNGRYLNITKRRLQVSGGIAPCTPNLGNIWSQVNSYIICSLYTRGSPFLLV